MDFAIFFQIFALIFGHLYFVDAALQVEFFNDKTNAKNLLALDEYIAVATTTNTQFLQSIEDNLPQLQRKNENADDLPPPLQNDENTNLEIKQILGLQLCDKNTPESTRDEYCDAIRMKKEPNGLLYLPDDTDKIPPCFQNNPLSCSPQIEQETSSTQNMFYCKKTIVKMSDGVDRSINGFAVSSSNANGEYYFTYTVSRNNEFTIEGYGLRIKTGLNEENFQSLMTRLVG